MTISLHENGRKHKENVTKKISAMHKKSAQEHKASVKMDKEIRQMEAAGLKAYMDDIKSNADITSISINETLAKTNSMLVLGGSVGNVVEPEPNKSVEKKVSNKNNSNNKKNKNKKGSSSKKGDTKDKSADVSLWYEAKTDDGNIYYWHIQTKESVWEPPGEGYMTIAEQESLLEKQKNDLDKLEADKKLIEKEIIEEQRAQSEREKYKRIKIESIDSIPESTYRYGPTNKVDPYGKWTTVSSTSKSYVDLQLPEQEPTKVPIFLPAVKPEKVFKEKIVQLQDDDSDDEKKINFKKRKIGASARRHVRQRTDDD